MGVQNGRLVISVGIETLAKAIEWAPSLEKFSEEDGEFQHPVIEDPDAFVGEVVRELEKGEEDGTTLVHRLLGTAAKRAVENGAEGVKLPI